ncbi:MAG TPA: DUF1641 domain-containing protein [Rubrivivax sp.]|jgi:plasmid maintenance system antidote protein VapI|nr:DUF1641 domain-containing protein [Pseudomonadota bacterium]HPP82670.1 DUF1641 domain-containing protein [Rubrivivax sp.]
MDTPTERVRPLDVEVERVIAAARDSLTDEMVTRLAATAGDAVDLIDQVNRAGLGRALPALTKLVASGDVDRLSQLAGVYRAAEDALTDEMVGRLTQAVGDGLALIDQVNRSGLERAIPVLSELVASGDLQRLARLARVYASAEDALTDEMIGRLTDTLGSGLSLLDRFSRGGAERVVGMLEGLHESGALERIAATLPALAERLATVQELLGAVDDAAKASRAAPRSAGGFGGLWQMLRDPEAQDTLRFMLALGKQLRQNWGTQK